MSRAAPARRGVRITGRQVMQLLAGVALCSVLLVWGLPRFGKTTWAQVWDILGQVTLWQGLGFLALVLLGLWSYTFTLAASLPGLSHLRAFIVNVCGSSVSNLLPGGGAVGLDGRGDGKPVCRFGRAAGDGWTGGHARAPGGCGLCHPAFGR